MPKTTHSTHELRKLAQQRLDKVKEEMPESEEIKRLRAEGYVVAGTPDEGYVILPPECD